LIAPRLAIVAFLLAASACENPPPRADRPVAREVPCDSSQAARLALDSLARLDSFPSAVVRFERDSTGVRIVTGPDRQAGATVVDGMAVVRVTPTCRIASLVQTDSA